MAPYYIASKYTISYFALILWMEHSHQTGMMHPVYVQSQCKCIQYTAADSSRPVRKVEQAAQILWICGRSEICHITWFAWSWIHLTFQTKLPAGRPTELSWSISQQISLPTKLWCICSSWLWWTPNWSMFLIYNFIKRNLHYLESYCGFRYLLHSQGTLQVHVT